MKGTDEQKTQSPAKPGLRYLFVIACGFAIDILVAVVSASYLGVDRRVATAMGLSAGLITNYLLFEYWAFRKDTSKFSVKRFSATVAAGLIALAVRLAIIGAIAPLIERGLVADAMVFFAAAGGSMLVNLLIVSRIFRGRPKSTRPAD